jgi:DNA-directed RNA polymerase specialized sigma24 family protein
MSTATDARPATLDELRAKHAKTPAQAAALRAADQQLFEQHPGKHVAYADAWSGDTLHREVVIAAASAVEFQRLLAALPEHVRKVVILTQMPDADVFDCPSVWIVEEHEL